MQKGLRSLLRGTRSRQDRRRIAPPFWCAVAASLLTMPAAAWAQPTPDQPPVGLRDDAPTALAPDAPAPAASTVSASPPAPPDRAVETPQQPPQGDAPVLPAVTVAEAQPAGRHFAPSTKPQRRLPPVVETAAGRTISLSTMSYELNSRPYVLAAVCLVILVLGSGTLLTVLARLRPTRERVA